MAKFVDAVEVILRHEGGYVNNPSDPGGETNFGISKRSYPKLDIKNLTRERAMEIYLHDFWTPGRYALIESQDVATKVFDMAVNMGPRRAHFITQKALRDLGHKLAQDGIMGDPTIEAINKELEARMLQGLRQGAKDFYLALNKPEFENGWLRRALS